MEEQFKQANSIYSDLILSEEFKKFLKKRAVIASRIRVAYETNGFSREEAILFTVEDMKEMKVQL